MVAASTVSIHSFKALGAAFLPEDESSTTFIQGSYSTSLGSASCGIEGRVNDLVARNFNGLEALNALVLQALCRHTNTWM